jgi:hypothetical protein
MDKVPKTAEATGRIIPSVERRTNSPHSSGFKETVSQFACLVGLFFW